MWGFMPGEVRMQPRLAGLGPQAWATRLGELRGHTFHYSVTESPIAPVAMTKGPALTTRQEAVYAQGPVRASYFHAWFASNPEATAQLMLGGVL
jgi:cobyrinic acid a,c-diamide synthase